MTRIFRILAVLVLLALCVAPVMAQATPTPEPSTDELVNTVNELVGLVERLAGTLAGRDVTFFGVILTILVAFALVIVRLTPSKEDDKAIERLPQILGDVINSTIVNTVSTIADLIVDILNGPEEEDPPQDGPTSNDPVG